MAEDIKQETSVEAEAQVDAEAQPQGDQEVPESIGLQDLQLLANIVDLASQRGAFRGNELSQVGAVFDKLSTFLNYVAQQQAEAQDAESVDEEVEAPAEGE
tara:strand:- start:234 stop:536 length:303 start_codon:yes stop_codon:yes gene_type:complete